MIAALLEQRSESSTIVHSRPIVNDKTRCSQVCHIVLARTRLGLGGELHKAQSTTALEHCTGIVQLSAILQHCALLVLLALLLGPSCSWAAQLVGTRTTRISGGTGARPLARGWSLRLRRRHHKLLGGSEGGDQS